MRLGAGIGCLLALAALAATGCSQVTGRVEATGARAAAITAGYAHTCALMKAGAVECWGYNGHGQLGDGTSSDRHTPTTVRARAARAASPRARA